jgi:Sugar (and other) transporter
MLTSLFVSLLSIDSLAHGAIHICAMLLLFNRGKAISVCVITNFSFNLLVTFGFPVELDLIGPAATFFIFAAITVMAIYFINTRVVETKGLSLEKIEQLFMRIGNGESIK